MVLVRPSPAVLFRVSPFHGGAGQGCEGCRRSERRRNEFRRGGRAAPRRNPAAGGAAARRGRRGHGEARWWPGKKGGAVRQAPCGAGPGPRPRPRPAGSEPQRGERWASRKVGRSFGGGGGGGRRGPLGKLRLRGEAGTGLPGGAGRAAASCCGPRWDGLRAAPAPSPGPLPWSPPRVAGPGAPFPPRLAAAGRTLTPRRSRQDFSGQVPPKLGRGKELAVVLFPEAKCLSASDGPLQTSFPGEPAGAVRGG